MAHFTLWDVPELLGYPDDYHYIVRYGVSDNSVKLQVTSGGALVTPVQWYFETREQAEEFIRSKT